jgi:hypothetical protein
MVLKLHQPSLRRHHRFGFAFAFLRSVSVKVSRLHFFQNGGSLQSAIRAQLQRQNQVSRATQGVLMPKLLDLRTSPRPYGRPVYNLRERRMP